MERMMSTFSEESLLLVRSWDAYQDIMEAGERLKAEMGSLLSAVGEGIKKEKWWTPDWQIHTPKEQLYLVHSKWRHNETDIIWIGVEGFKPEAVFGNSPPPWLYVYIEGKWPGLKQELLSVIQAKEDFPGELDASASNGYVIRDSLTKCLPEEAETFEETAAASLIEFVKFYAALFPEFDKAVRKCVKAGE